MANFKTKNCPNCGKKKHDNDDFCSTSCEEKYDVFINKPFKSFRSYLGASKYFNKNQRTIKKYENILFKIDRSIPDPNIKFFNCKLCGEKDKSSLSRSGYCKKCTKLGLGHKEGGKKLSKLFKGKGNPNYVHGKTKKSISDRKNQWYSWGRFVFFDNKYKCILSGRKDDLQSHHIIPFCLFPQYRFLRENGIVLNRFYHIELHRQSLDLLLLPNLFESLQDVRQLTEWFVRQPLIQSLLELPYQKHDRHELIRVVGRHSNSHRQLRHLHPKFDLSSLNHLVL